MRMERIGRSDFLEFMKSDGSTFWSVVDPVAWQELSEILLKYDPEYLLLYKGRPTEPLLRVLPRVIRLEPCHDFTAQFLKGYSNGWGIIVQSDPAVSIVDITDEQLALSYAKLPEGDLAWLRYYDPYVAKTLLPSFGADQRALFFGKYVQSFIVEEPETNSWLRLARPDDLPVSTREPVLLSPGQLELLSEAHYELIAFELTQYCLDAFFPDVQGSDQESIKTAIRNSMETAESYGFTSIDAVRRFVELAAQFGWDFHLSPGTSAILSKSCPIPDVKLEDLESYMLPDTSEEEFT